MTPQMMKSFLFFFLLFTGFIHAQLPKRCVTIDFETILDLPSTEGQLISDQFVDSMGIRFSLEGGRVPQLAQIGSPTTAFDGAFGPDTPAPGQNTGSFFLTDNGTLSGLFSPPLIVRFDFPASEASGVILDIDFGERFLIQLFDQNDQLLEEIEIEAGMSGTGDAIATP